MISDDELDQLVTGVTRVRMVTNTDTGTVVEPLPTWHRDGHGPGYLSVLFDGDDEASSVAPATMEIIPG